MENVSELWQAEVNGQIYEASFEELAQWIQEGAVLPQDKVRRGNLRWIEANRVPALLGYFNATTSGDSQPLVQTVEAPHHQPDFTKLEGINCVLHPEIEAQFYCETCINYFCNNCPKTSGGLSNCCPLCGAICSSLQSAETVPPVIENNQVEEEFVPPEIKHAAHQTVRNQAMRTNTVVEAPKRGFTRVIGGFLLACIVAVVVGYLWASQFSVPDEAGEKKISELVVLEEKYNSDRQFMRLEFANAATNSLGENYEQAQIRLKVNYDQDRATIISEHRDQQFKNNFYMAGGIAFLIMIFGMILIKAMTSK